MVTRGCDQLYPAPIVSEVLRGITDSKRRCSVYLWSSFTIVQIGRDFDIIGRSGNACYSSRKAVLSISASPMYGLTSAGCVWGCRPVGQRVS